MMGILIITIIVLSRKTRFFKANSIYFFPSFVDSIKSISSIQCYTCSQSGYRCPVPLNLDAGDESNENEIDAQSYDSSFACMVNLVINCVGHFLSRVFVFLE